MIQQSFSQVFEIFFKLKMRDLISLEEPILQNGRIIWSLLLYFNISSFKDPNSLSCIRFQWILNDSAVFFSCFWKLFNLKRGDVISWGNQFWRTAELFGPSSCISILEVQKTQILCHSLHFNAFSMIQQYFSQVFANSSN